LDVTVAGTTCVQLSSLVEVLLPIKAVALEGTLDVISRVLTLAVYTLEGVRARSTICGCLPRRVGFVAPSYGSMVFHSIWSTTLLTLSTLSTTCVGWMSPAPAVATLGNSRMHSSPPNCGCVTSKVE